MTEYPWPPYMLMADCAMNAPTAISTYMYLWRAFLNYENPQMLFTPADIEEGENFEWIKFMKDVRLLARQGLLEYQLTENKQAVAIILAECEFTERSDELNGYEGHTLC